jgi:hypothetical protein
MRKWWINGLCVLVAGVLAVSSVGCGDDDDDSNSLTTEEQYDVISEYFSFDPNDQSGAIDVTGIALGLLSGEYWDGIDTSDATGLVKRLVPNAKRIADDSDSLFVDYSVATGWWVIYYRATVEGEGGEFGLAFRDSVRYSDASGNSQIEPSETTDRIDLRQQLTSHVTGVAEGLAAHGDDHFDLETTANSRLAITRASIDMAEVNGTASVTFDLDASKDDTAAVIILGLGSEYSELMIPLAGFEGGPCPTSGGVTADFDADVTLEAGEETAHAEGSWDATIDFTGDGSATVEVQSGDFSRDYTGPVCEPPVAP